MSKIIEYDIMMCCLINANEILMTVKFFKNWHVNAVKQNFKCELVTRLALFVKN